MSSYTSELINRIHIANKNNKPVTKRDGKQRCTSEKKNCFRLKSIVRLYENSLIRKSRTVQRPL